MNRYLTLEMNFIYKVLKYCILNIKETPEVLLRLEFHKYSFTDRQQKRK